MTRKKTSEKRSEKRAASPARSSPRRTTRRQRLRQADQRPLVLVVDDFRDGRELVVETLEYHDLRTAQAADGHEALAQARDLHPALILMDLSLPGVDGWEVTRRLKSDPATRDIKVVAFTAHAQSDALRRAAAAGADATLTKPCLPSEVLEQVCHLLGIEAPTPGTREEV